MLEQAVAGLAGGVWAPVISLIGGSIGAIVRGVLDVRARKLEIDHEHRMAVLDANAEIRAREHELALHEANLRRAEAETLQAVERARADSEIRRTEKDLEALIQSHKPGAAPDPKMDRIRAWVRIVLTLGSGLVTIGLTVYIAYLVGGLGALGQDVLKQLLLLLVVTCASLASLSFGWWFATRPTVRKWMEMVQR